VLKRILIYPSFRFIPIDIPSGKRIEVKVNKKVIRIVLTWHALDGADDYIITANELLNFLLKLKYWMHH
jgi:hypothetical protein